MININAQLILIVLQILIAKIIVLLIAYQCALCRKSLKTLHYIVLSEID